MSHTTMGEFSLNLNATLCIGPCKITALSLTETAYMGINSEGTSREAKLGKKKKVRLHGRPGTKRSWFRRIWFKQKCWWNLITLSDALTCIFPYFFFPSACKDENERCKSWALNGECEKNPKYMLFNCSKSCGVCPGMHDAQEVK